MKCSAVFLFFCAGFVTVSALIFSVIRTLNEEKALRLSSARPERYSKNNVDIDGDRWVWGYANEIENKNDSKIDGDRWIWGYVDEIEKKHDSNIENRNEDQERKSTTEKPSDPCLPFDPPKPSFKAPGRRISDEKCEEYKWARTVQEEVNRRRRACRKIGTMGKFGIVGGRSTYSGEFTDMGAIGWKTVLGDYVFKCGSTLISSKFVITAAHCSRASVMDHSLEDVVPKIIRLSNKNLFETDAKGKILSEDVNIARVIVHPMYKAPKAYYDIALIEMEWEVTFTTLIQPACLWTKADVSELGQEATLNGWGVLRQGGYEISPELQAAVVNFIDSSFCDQLLYSSRNRNWWGVQEHQVCAGILAGGVDSCQGDSGGPLQVKKHITGSNKQTMCYVVGVTSFGIGCAIPNHPGIYTRVSSFVDWIEGYVWPQ